MAEQEASCFWTRDRIEAAREEYFGEMIREVAERHPRYRRLLAERNLGAGDFASLADIAKLPLTPKSDYMAAPDDYLLDSAGLPEEMQAVWDTMYTTGSTGRPTPFVSTAFDFFNTLTLNRNMLLLRGVTKTDIIANLFPLTRYPHGAFTRAQQAAAVMNIPVVAALPGNPSLYFAHGNRVEEAAQIVERHRATILWGVPSFIRRLLQSAEAQGANFSHVRLVFVTGEALYPEARADLRQRLEHLGAKSVKISGSYGMTEIQGGFVECEEGSGFHNPLPEQILVEVVDGETHMPRPDGEEGLVVISHLNRRGTVLLRYVVGDVAVLDRGTCPVCGSQTDRLVSTPRRVDSLVKIKGMLVNPEPLLARLSGEASLKRFALKVAREDPSDRLSPDVLQLVAVVDTSEAEALKERLTNLIKSESGVTPVVEFVSEADFEEGDRRWKAKPFSDER